MQKNNIFKIRSLRIFLPILFATIGFGGYFYAMEASTSQVEFWENMGIYGGRVSDMTIDPSSDWVYLVLSGYPGVYRSQDDGENWEETGTGFAGASRIICRQNVVYANFDTGLMKSSTGGETWDTVVDYSTLLSITNVSGFDVDSNATEHIVIGHQRIYVTWNGGQDWVTATSNIQGKYHINGMSIDPSNPDGMVVYAINSSASDFTQPSIINRSIDGGVSYTSVFTQPVGEQFYAIGTNELGTVYAGGTNGLFRSANGIDWQHVISDVEIYSVNFSPVNSATVFVDGYVSYDDGYNWEAFNVHEYFVQSPNNPDLMFTLGELGVSRSLDGGDTWFSSVKGIEGVEITNAGSDPFDNQIMYINSPNGVGRTMDGGKNWDYPIGQSGAWGFAEDPNTSGVIYAGDFFGWVHKSVNYGDTWTHSLVDGMALYPVHDIAVDPRNSNRIYAAVGGFDPQTGDQHGGLYISDDGGVNWFTSTLNQIPVSAVQAISSITETILYAGLGETGGLADGGVYRSIDSGENWTYIGFGDKTVIALAVHPLNPDVVYVGTYNPPSNHPMYRSDNGGDDWVSLGESDCESVHEIAIDPNDPDFIYVSGCGKIYQSANQGENWILFHEGKPAEQILSIHIPFVSPSPVDSFVSLPLTSSVLLSWTYPITSDSVNVNIRYLTNTFPTNHTMGVSLTLQQGSNGNYQHMDVISDTTYYYAAFAIDGDGRYSAPVWISTTLPITTNNMIEHYAQIESVAGQGPVNEKGTLYIATSYGFYRYNKESEDGFNLYLPLVSR